MELPRLDDLYDRSQKNDVQDVRMLNPEQVKDIEPNCKVEYQFWGPFHETTDIIRKLIFKQNPFLNIRSVFKMKTGNCHVTKEPMKDNIFASHSFGGHNTSQLRCFYDLK